MPEPVYGWSLSTSPTMSSRTLSCVDILPSMSNQKRVGTAPVPAGCHARAAAGDCGGAGVEATAACVRPWGGWLTVDGRHVRSAQTPAPRFAWAEKFHVTLRLELSSSELVR